MKAHVSKHRVLITDNGRMLTVRTIQTGTMLAVVSKIKMEATVTDRDNPTVIMQTGIM